MCRAEQCEVAEPCPSLPVTREPPLLVASRDKGVSPHLWFRVTGVCPPRDLV